MELHPAPPPDSGPPPTDTALPARSPEQLAAPSPSGPVPVLPGPGRAWPLHDAASTRAAEAQALALAAPQTLMERAGLGVARLALALAPHASRLLVAAGPGNNGGDGLVAARLLHQAGRRVEVVLVGDPASQPPDAHQALQSALHAGVSVGSGRLRSANADLLIDALLGLGARRAPNADLAEAIATLNRAGSPVLSVDLPSGLCPDSGALLGTEAVQAQATLQLLTLKPGAFTAQGRACCGDLWLDTLGVDAGPATAWLGGAWSRPARQHPDHKGRFGQVVVVGGSAGMEGAATLAARAALAAGAGRVTLSTLAPRTAGPDVQTPELMQASQWWLGSPASMAETTLVCGCGGGDDLGPVLPALLTHVPRLVLDADGLNAVAAEAKLASLLRARSSRGQQTVLTPHPLEAARLLRCQTAEVQGDRLRHALALAQATRCCVVLKGSGTVVTSPDGPPTLNPSGNAALASPGTGDVLAGWIGGLWAAQPGVPPEQVACQAVWQHGDAADRFARQQGLQALQASELIHWLRHAR